MGHTSAGSGISGTDLVGCVTSLDWHTSSFRRPSHQALTLLGGARFIAWCLRRPFLGECRRGPRHFWECRVCLGYGPAPLPTVKILSATLVRLVGRATNTVNYKMLLTIVHSVLNRSISIIMDRYWLCNLMLHSHNMATRNVHRMFVTYIHRT